MSEENELSNKHTAGTVCFLISIPLGFFSALYFFSDLWGWIQIKLGWIPMPVEGPGLGIMIGFPMLVAATVLWNTGKGLLKDYPKK